MYAKYAELRDAKGVKDADVSAATGIPRSFFTDWKQGRYSPKIDKLLKIAEFFDVSINEFIDAR